jgi:hypothetical protein
MDNILSESLHIIRSVGNTPLRIGKILGDRKPRKIADTANITSCVQSSVGTTEIPSANGLSVEAHQTPKNDSLWPATPRGKQDSLRQVDSYRCTFY